MSGREKIEKNYKESEKRIDLAVEEELAQIKKEANEVRSEAERIGEAVEISLNQTNEPRRKKKS